VGEGELVDSEPVGSEVVGDGAASEGVRVVVTGLAVSVSVTTGAGLAEVVGVEPLPSQALKSKEAETTSAKGLPAERAVKGNLSLIFQT